MFDGVKSEYEGTGESDTPPVMGVSPPEEDEVEVVVGVCKFDRSSADDLTMNPTLYQSTDGGGRGLKCSPNKVGGLTRTLDRGTPRGFLGRGPAPRPLS